MRAPNIRPTARRVLRYVPATALNATCAHAIAQLASMTGKSVRRELDYLEELGLVRVVGGGSRGGGQLFIRNYGGAR